MTWTAASPGFPAAFSLLARGGGAAASPGQRGRAAPVPPPRPPGRKVRGRGGPRRPLGRGDSPVPREKERPGAGKAGAPGLAGGGCAGAQHCGGEGDTGKAPAPAVGAPLALPRPRPGLKRFSARRLSASFRVGGVPAGWQRGRRASLRGTGDFPGRAAQRSRRRPPPRGRPWSPQTGASLRCCPSSGAARQRGEPSFGISS